MQKNSHCRTTCQIADDQRMAAVQCSFAPSEPWDL